MMAKDGLLYRFAGGLIEEHSNLKINAVRGRANGYGQGREAGDGGKCPLCGSPILEQSRFCRDCTVLFAAWLRKVYKREVKFARDVEPTGGVVAAGRRSRQRTLETLRANGPTTTVDLAQAVGMTPEGVRYQLKKMQETREVVLVSNGYRHIWRANKTLTKE